MTEERFIQTFTEAGEFSGMVALSSLGRRTFATLLRVSASTYKLSKDHNGVILEFSEACTVTVPDDLPELFCCGVSQGGAGQIELVPGEGVVLNEPDDQLKTASQYAMIIITKFASGDVRVGGRTAA